MGASAFTGSTGVQSRWAHTCDPLPHPAAPSPAFLSPLPQDSPNSPRGPAITLQFPLIELPNHPWWGAVDTRSEGIVSFCCVWPLSSLTRVLLRPGTGSAES